jgi:hypothetical protein
MLGNRWGILLTLGNLHQGVMLKEIVVLHKPHGIDNSCGRPRWAKHCLQS